MTAPRRRPVDLLAEFQNTYERGGPFIRALCERFALAGKSVASIASGSCAEEIAMAELGVAVDCIEPIAKHLDIGREQAARRAPSGAMEFHACRHEEFASAKRYDLIYSSGPQDWMSGDFRALVPEGYLAFFARFAAPRSVLVVRFWSDQHSPDVLTSDWFAKAMAGKFRTASAFRLREYWLSPNGRRALIVCTQGFDALPDDTGFASGAARFGGEILQRKFAWDADAEVALSGRERMRPYVLTARHRLRAVRDAVRRRLR